ncbi:MAG: hypothetical protein AAGF12_17830 [Myxococcota bacterium]
MRAFVSLALACSLLIGGCSERRPGFASPPAPDAETDGSLEPDPSRDGGQDGSSNETCSGRPVGAFALDPEARRGQIHPEARFDGDTLFVVYNLPDEGSMLDVYLRRFDCSGAPLGERERVNTIDNVGETDPTLAITDEGVMIAWIQDNSAASPTNLRTFFRRMDRDGTFVDAAEQRLETRRNGQGVNGNHLGVHLLALPDGEFLFSGARGHTESNVFQAYAQRLRFSGEVMGDALEPVVERDEAQLDVVAASTGGSLWLAYQRGTQAFNTDLTGSGEPSPLFPGAGESTNPSLVADRQTDRIYAAAAWNPDGDQDIHLTVAGVGSAVRLANPGFEFGPVLSPSEDGGGVVAYFSRDQNGTRVQVARFTEQATAVGTPVPIGNATAAPYLPTLTQVGADVWFVAWVERNGRDLILFGEFVELPSP